jgi:hypothetical protein
MNWYRGHKPVGTVIRRRDGKVYVKTEKGWEAESRLIARLKLIHRDLEEGEKAYHKDCTLIGTKDYNKPDNIVVLKFNVTKYRLLPSSEILYLPSAKKESAQVK